MTDKKVDWVSRLTPKTYLGKAGTKKNKGFWALTDFLFTGSRHTVKRAALRDKTKKANDE